MNDPTIMFGRGERPNEHELVVWDGFDALDKKDAVRFFRGKTWDDVLAHLRGLKDAWLFGAAYYQEEWSVLSPTALAYYARAYIEFLRETIASTKPDEEYVFFFLGSLRDVVRIGGLDAAQKAFFRDEVRRTAEAVAASGKFEYFADDINEEAEHFLAETAEPENPTGPR